MKGAVLFILALSMLFNVLFSAGFVKSRREATKQTQRESANAEWHGPGRGRGAGPEQNGRDGPMRLPGMRELDLSEQQREVFSQLRQSMHEENAVLESEMDASRRAMAVELESENPDADRLRDLVLRQAELMRQRRVASATRFAEFLNVLTPDQTRTMARQMLRHMPGPRDRGRGDGDRPGSGRPSDEFMRRFDANGDGDLDQAERAAAHEAFEARRREHEQQRAELRRRFDVDGNQRLDAAESEQMRQWLLENRAKRNGHRDRAQDEPGNAAQQHSPVTPTDSDGPAPPGR